MNLLKFRFNTQSTSIKKLGPCIGYPLQFSPSLRKQRKEDGGSAINLGRNRHWLFSGFRAQRRNSLWEFSVLGLISPMAQQEIIEPKKYYDAIQVSETTGDWTVIVQVVEKWKPELAKNRTSNLQKYVLTNMKGTQISAVSFNANIDTLERLLIPFRRYEISNADLKFLNPLYRIGPYAYEWILKTNQIIEEIHDERPYTLPCTFSLARFSDLSPYAELNEYLNVKALVVGSIPVYGFGDDVRDYILINEEKIPMVLRVWDNYLDNDDISVGARLPEPTLIIGFTLRVTTFHGISLSTAKYNTRFLIDPPYQMLLLSMNGTKETKRRLLLC